VAFVKLSEKPLIVGHITKTIMPNKLGRINKKATKVSSENHFLTQAGRERTSAG
jgi:hypothetical protein